MNQTLAAAVAHTADEPSSPLETPTLLAGDGRALASDTADFLGEVRTHMTTILGFSEMLADPSLALSDQRRAEYGFIVATSGALLAERLKRERDGLRLAS